MDTPLAHESQKLRQTSEPPTLSHRQLYENARYKNPEIMIQQPPQYALYHKKHLSMKPTVVNPKTGMITINQNQLQTNKDSFYQPV